MTPDVPADTLLDMKTHFSEEPLDTEDRDQMLKENKKKTPIQQR